MPDPSDESRPTMSPARFARVKELFAEALERDETERLAFLETACAGDPDLRSAVASLLASHEESGDFLSVSPLAGVAARAAPPPIPPAEAVIGRRVGPYKLLKELGHGGMGAVYLAARADAEFTKRVAIKLIRQGFGGTEVKRRFKNERQILASLDHPNIAKLLDGGTTDDGIPYIVMDYVEGLTITDYCDRARLSVRRRVELFRTILSAVHTAHQNLVVHRDLKPGNILVTPEGVPKLLDFGIAKLLAPELLGDDAETVVTLRLMTPEYASPEQVRGEPISTLSDVYSLGVVLYELVSGHRPYRVDSRSLVEIERAVCEAEPPKPSTAVTRVEAVGGRGSATREVTPEAVGRARDAAPARLRHELAGDVDAIVLKAMRKEPDRRYRSVEQFSADLERYLTGLPVEARGGAFAYRAGRYLERHAIGVAFAAALLVTLLGGIVATARQAVVAKRERHRAERRFEDVRKLANSFLFEFDEAIESLPGSTPARQLIVKRALEYLESLAKESAGDLSLQRELAKAYDKVGNMQGNPYVANLGDTAGANASYRKALAIREAVLAVEPKSVESRRDVTVSLDRLSEMMTLGGDVKGALANLRRGLAIAEAIHAEDPGAKRARRDVAVRHLKIGDVLHRMGEPAQALESHRKALAVLQANLAETPADWKARRDVIVSQTKVAQELEAQGDLEGAIANLTGVLANCEHVLEADPRNAIVARDQAIAFNALGEVFRKRGDAGKALDSHRRALAVAERMAAADPNDSQAKTDLAYTHNRVGLALAAAGDARGALAAHRRALAVAQTLTSPDTEAQEELAASHGYIGKAALLLRDTPLAISESRTALEMRRRLANADADDVALSRNVAQALVALGDAQAGSRNPPPPEAADSYREAADLLRKLKASGKLSAEDEKMLAALETKPGPASR